jgi:S1-C subfamily serine protease
MWIDRLRLLGCAGCLLATGCGLLGCGAMVEAPVQDKTASLGKAGLTDSDKRLLTAWLHANTSFVFRNAAGVESVKRSGDNRKFVVELTGAGGKMTGGLASAITLDGYHVTAAHVVAGKDRLLLVHGENGELVQEEARVVWRAPDGRDLALLKAGPRRHCFSLTLRKPQPGDVVMAAGASGGESAGCLTRVDTGRLLHTAPLRRGDSGGAVLDQRGALLGVNRATGMRLSGERWNEAVPLDVDEIKAVIENDRR